MVLKALAVTHRSEALLHSVLRGIGAAFLGMMLTQCVAVEPLEDLEKTNLESGTNTIRLVPLGRYSNGFYEKSSTTPPTYDPVTKRLYVVRTDEGVVLVLDISDPADPKKAFRIDAGGQPISVDIKNGILAVAVRRLVKTERGSVVFFDADGQRIGRALQVGTMPISLKFTPSGERVVVANAGEADNQYIEDPEGSITIIDLGSFSANDCRRGAESCNIKPRASEIDFQNFNAERAALLSAGVRLYGPDASVAQDFEPESLAISADSQTAWVSLQRNNAIAVVDIPNKRVREIIPLGSKDHSLPGNGLDASNADNAINIRTWPIRSFYQPDDFKPYTVGANTFLVTANEGDPRDFKGFSEVDRVKDLNLDPTAFPNAADLQRPDALGNLIVSNVDGDSDGDGDFDQLFAIGSRSFATWSVDWQLISDSGDQLEQVTAQAVPDYFNVADDENRFDAKSDARGPEPEALDVGQVDGRHYVFIAPERVGGVYVYDITDPANTVFQQYINVRNFSINPDSVCQTAKPQSWDCAPVGDLGPEGVLFISEEDSPIDAPLVVIAHEVSDSITTFRVDRVP